MLARREFMAAAASSVVAKTPGVSVPSKMLDVLIIGAGLSGLKAASDLEELGYSVQVIEGRQRVGGRVYSLDDVPGHPEAGANNIMSGYGRCLDVAERLALPLKDYAGRLKISPQQLYLRDKYIPAIAWAKHPQNILPAQYASKMPWEITSLLLNKTNPLKSSDDWTDQQNLSYDIPVHELFAREGFNEAQTALAYNLNAYFGTSSFDVSLLMAYYNDLWLRTMMSDPKMFAVVGGNSRLPEAMARTLKREVLFGKGVIGITSLRDHAEVLCEGDILYKAKRVICTVPLPTMRYIRFDPALPDKFAKATQTMNYMPLTQVHLVATEKFWEQDGLSPAMWSDSEFGSITVNRFNVDNDDVTSLTAFARGFDAVRLDQHDPEDAKQLVVTAIERARPAAKGKLRAVAIKSWLRDRFSGGDWAIWGPGQIREFLDIVAVPHGRIHFAGEHTARSNRGMEGAMESGERVAQEAAGLI